MNMDSQWSKIILRNFDEASNRYDDEASLQKDFAWKLSQHCANESIQKGIWVDLGTGTGFLADALEKSHPGQSVIRVDGSQKMLTTHHREKKTQLWDLNKGLPTWPQQPTLIASNFALHWLTNPTKRISEWLEALAPGGWLALSIPVDGSFSEWQYAAQKAKVPFSAIPLPSQATLLKALNNGQVRHQRLHHVIKKADNLTSLLKQISKVGAHASKKPKLSVGELRRLEKAWPRSNGYKRISLTWHIQVLLIQR